jgi:DNA-binding NarL/FixJ family response regulator
MKILIVDDHALFREGMKLILPRLDPSATLVEAGSAEAGLSHAAAQEEFDLILLDLNLPGMRGADGVRLFRQRFPTSPIAVLTGVDSAEAVRDCMQKGAQAFIPKSVNSDVMIDALREVLGGGQYFPADTGLSGKGGASAKLPRSPWKLTLRQIDVLALVSRGHSNKEIARELGMSDNTVRAHLAAIFREMGARSRTEVAALAHRHGII